MSNNSQRSTRKSRKPREEIVTKPKFLEAAESKLTVFIPTPSQKTLINAIRENTLTFVDSPAGTGKSSTVLWHFAKEYLHDHKKGIIVIRTPVEFCDDKIGYLPSTLDAKLEVHFAAPRKILEDFLGKGRVEADSQTRIQFMIPNYLLGATLTNQLILIDEAQQLSPQILKLLLERIGEGCKVVVAGSSDQLFDAKGKRNGLKDALERFFDIDDEFVTPKYPDVGFHEFDVEEVMRSQIVKTVIKAYSEKG
jgi:phosphate starvation-inducible PhoH-like protein